MSKPESQLKQVVHLADPALHDCLRGRPGRFFLFPLFVKFKRINLSQKEVHIETIRRPQAGYRQQTVH